MQAGDAGFTLGLLRAPLGLLGKRVGFGAWSLGSHCGGPRGSGIRGFCRAYPPPHDGDDIGSDYADDPAAGDDDDVSTRSVPAPKVLAQAVLMTVLLLGRWRGLLCPHQVDGGGA